MAAEYLAGHGVDLDAVLSGVTTKSQAGSPSISRISNVHIPSCVPETLHDVTIRNGTIKSIEPSQPRQLDLSHLPGVLDGQGGLLAPSLCHAHVHIDKCFLLQDEKYNDLEIVKGDFAEAMSITGQAKARFSEDDLLRRGRRLLDESIDAGVTCMRAFVEVDEVAQMKSLDACIMLKEEYEDRCNVQICAFAQLAVFDDRIGLERRDLMEVAVKRREVEAIGSTPYVEQSADKMLQCVQWTIELSLKHKKHLDFHLDYNLDASQKALIWDVIEELDRQQWQQHAAASQTICFGHCTRLTLFKEDEWKRLADAVKGLPISFVGLPTSDLFMMGRPDDLGSQRERATLQLPEMVQRYGLRCAMSINNIGNAFTPYGPVDPVALASLGMGVYQTGTKQAAGLLYVSVLSSINDAVLILLGTGIKSSKSCNRCDICVS
jgi:cytosine/adenosine deaminase-related metal-dependent hydrolase